jgi:hypothetical protein
MALSLERVKGIMGSEEQSGIPDAAIKDALWEYYFDIGQTVEWMEGTCLTLVFNLMKTLLT